MLGFLARDPVAATGMGVLGGTWAVVGLTTLISPPGSTSRGLTVLLVPAGLAMAVPALAAAPATLAPAAVVGLAGLRFPVTAGHQWTGAPGGRPRPAGWA